MTWKRWKLVWCGCLNWAWGRGWWPDPPEKAPLCAFDWWRIGPLELRRLRHAEWRRCRFCGARLPRHYHGFGLLCDGCRRFD